MQKLIVSLSIVTILLASTWSTAFGMDQLPWGVERVRAYCLWDNDNAVAQNATAWDIDPPTQSLGAGGGGRMPYMN